MGSDVRLGSSLAGKCPVETVGSTSLHAWEACEEKKSTSIPPAGESDCPYKSLVGKEIYEKVQKVCVWGGDPDTTA